MPLINAIYRRVALPIFERERHRGLARRMRAIECEEGHGLEVNRERQWRSLTALLRHAYESSAFYRRRFDEAGVHPCDVLSPADFEKIPPLTRNDLRDHLPALLSDRYRRAELLRSATGGTTDTPVSFYRDRESVRQKTAVQLRFDAWAGFAPGDKVFYLWGAQSDYPQNPSWRWRLYDNVLMRRVWAQTSFLRPEILESHRQKLNHLRPRVIYAYPTPLAIFCEYLRDSGRDYHRPSSIICTAEALPEKQRELIRATFDCEPFEQYGSREFGMIAGECAAHRGMHLNPAAAYVEFVPLADSDGLHEVFVTDLLNYAMPLIRYRSNDCAIPGEHCGCGIGYPTVQKIVGRTSEIFQLPDGSRVPGVSLTNRVIQVAPGLEKIQVVQETLRDFHIRYVAGPGFSQPDLENLKTNLAKFFPRDLRWNFEPVQEIAREPSGKTRFCISRVRGPAALSSTYNHIAGTSLCD